VLLKPPATGCDDWDLRGNKSSLHTKLVNKQCNNTDSLLYFKNGSTLGLDYIATVLLTSARRDWELPTSTECILGVPSNYQNLSARKKRLLGN
jgi:hypothetical protein